LSTEFLARLGEAIKVFIAQKRQLLTPRTAPPAGA
jgi:hypothetical protein